MTIGDNCNYLQIGNLKAYRKSTLITSCGSNKH